MSIQSRIGGFNNVRRTYGLKVAIHATAVHLTGGSAQEALPSLMEPKVRKGGWRRPRKQTPYVTEYSDWVSRNQQKLTEPSKAADVFTRDKIALVADLGLPQCKKYRVMQKYEAFRNAGILVSFSNWLDQTRCLSMLQTATHVVFYRVPQHKFTQAYLDEARRLGLKVIYEIDDPIFDLDVYSENSGLDFLSKKEKAGLLESAADYAAFMQKCDYMIASTPGLQDLMSRRFAVTSVLWRNLVDAETREAAKITNELRKLNTAPSHDNSTFVLGYMSGSRAHEANFRTISSQIAKIMGAYENIRFKIVGHLELGKEFEPFKDRIDKVPFVSYDIYIRELGGVNLNLVPLTIDGFNECKSAIRYLEASLLKIPTLVSSVGDFKSIIDNGQNGFLLESYDDWYEKMVEFIKYPDKAKAMGEAAFSNVEERYMLTGVPQSAASLFTRDVM